MVTIKIVCVGNIKENYYVSAIKEYSTRLSRFAKVSIIEVKESTLPKNYSDKDIEIVKEKERENIEKHLGGYIIVLDVQGNNISSEDLAKKIDTVSNISSTITFVIGGSYGLSEEIKNKSDYKLSFSKMTFPHQLMRVVLLEQVYRAFTINNNITYHK